MGALGIKTKRKYSLTVFVSSLNSVDVLLATGLYLNDLSMYDSSRDLVLAGQQQAAEMRLAFDQYQQKSGRLEGEL